jgi:hypothetical protein
MIYYGNNWGRGARVIASTLYDHPDRDKWYTTLPREYHLGGNEIPWTGWANAPASERGIGIFRRGDKNIIVFLHKTEQGDDRDGGGYLYHWLLVDYKDMLALNGNWLWLIDKIRNEHLSFVRHFDPSRLVELAQMLIHPAQIQQFTKPLDQYQLAEAILNACFVDKDVSIFISNIPTVEERARIAQQIINILPPALRGILPFTLTHVAYGNQNTYLDFDSPNHAKYQVDWISQKNNLPKPTHIVARLLIECLQAEKLDTFHQQWNERLTVWMREEKGNWRTVMHKWATWLHIEQTWNRPTFDEAIFKDLFHLLDGDVTLTSPMRYKWLTESIDKLLAHPHAVLREQFTGTVCQQIQRLDDTQIVTLHQYLRSLLPVYNENLIRWLLRWQIKLDKKWNNGWDEIVRQLFMSHTTDVFQMSDITTHKEWLVFIQSQLAWLMSQDDWYHILGIGIQSEYSVSNNLVIHYIIQILDVANIERFMKQYAIWMQKLPNEYALLVGSQAGIADDHVINTLRSFPSSDIEKIIQLQLKYPTALFKHLRFVELLVDEALKRDEASKRNEQTIYDQGVMWVHQAFQNGDVFDDNILFRMLYYFLMQNNQADAQLYYQSFDDTQFDTFFTYITPYTSNAPHLMTMLVMLNYSNNKPLRQFHVLSTQIQMNQSYSPYAIQHIIESLNMPDVSHEFIRDQYHPMYIQMTFESMNIMPEIKDQLFYWMLNQARACWMVHRVEDSGYWLVLCCQYGQGHENHLHNFFAQQIIAQSSLDDLSTFLQYGRNIKTNSPELINLLQPLLQRAQDSLRQVHTRELADKILREQFLIIPLLTGLDELEKAFTHLNGLYAQIEREEIDLSQLVDLLQGCSQNQNIPHDLNALPKRIKDLQMQLSDLIRDFERDDIPKFKLLGTSRKSAEDVIDELLRGENKNPPKSRLAMWFSVMRGWIHRK